MDIPKKDVARFRDNLQDEVEGAALYAALAAAETDPVRKDLFLQLSQAEAGHAQFWRDKLVAADSCQCVAFAQGALHVGGQGHQQPVASIMAEPVIDGLEAIEVDEHQADT